MRAGLRGFAAPCRDAARAKGGAPRAPAVNTGRGGVVRWENACMLLINAGGSRSRRYANELRTDSDMSDDGLLAAAVHGFTSK